MGIFSLKNSTISLLLIIAIALSAWSIILSKQVLPTKDHDSNQPDAYMENIVAVILNKEGKPSLKIEAPKMVHYAENNTTHITHPHVTAYRQSPQPWYINSDSAQALNGLERVIFTRNVVIYHPSDLENPNTTMHTNALTIFPDKQQAETNDAITITQPDTIVHAVGMLADLNDGTIKLLSQAKGEYVPNS
jgi:lipopolysaccharide export system protein LptC